LSLSPSFYSAANARHETRLKNQVPQPRDDCGMTYSYDQRVQGICAVIERGFSKGLTAEKIETLVGEQRPYNIETADLNSLVRHVQKTLKLQTEGKPTPWMIHEQLELFTM